MCNYVKEQILLIEESDTKSYFVKKKGKEGRPQVVTRNKRYQKEFSDLFLMQVPETPLYGMGEAKGLQHLSASCEALSLVPSVMVMLTVMLMIVVVVVVLMIIAVEVVGVLPSS